MSSEKHEWGEGLKLIEIIKKVFNMGDGKKGKTRVSFFSGGRKVVFFAKKRRK